MAVWVFGDVYHGKRDASGKIDEVVMPQCGSQEEQRTISRMPRVKDEGGPFA